MWELWTWSPRLAVFWGRVAFGLLVARAFSGETVGLALGAWSLGTFMSHKTHRALRIGLAL